MSADQFAEYVAGPICQAILLTTIWDTVSEVRFDHDHGCKLPAGHDEIHDASDALHECIRCGERWASKVEGVTWNLR